MKEEAEEEGKRGRWTKLFHLPAYFRRHKSFDAQENMFRRFGYADFTRL